MLQFYFAINKKNYKVVTPKCLIVDKSKINWLKTVENKKLLIVAELWTATEIAGIAKTCKNA